MSCENSTLTAPTARHYENTTVTAPTARQDEATTAPGTKLHIAAFSRNALPIFSRCLHR